MNCDNRKITDGQYDKSLAVKCMNGTFVGKEMWTNFARTGNPSTDKYEWKKFSGEDRQTMVFDDTIGMQKDIFGKREDLMMSWARRLGNGSSKRVC